MFCYQKLKEVEDYIRSTAGRFFDIAEKYFNGDYQPKIENNNLAIRSHLDIIKGIK